MSTKYKFIYKQGVYFTTATVVSWLDDCQNGTGRFLGKMVGIEKFY